MCRLSEEKMNDNRMVSGSAGNTTKGCKIIAISNQKGGVGKTTTCVNLGIGLARAGEKVLLVEADAQGSLAVSLGISEPDKLDVTLVNILEKVINDEEFSVHKLSSYLGKKGLLVKDNSRDYTKKNSNGKRYYQIDLKRLEEETNMYLMTEP